ncbi:MAG TPA: apolipoprotein N-acyltransferase [Dongiaceae bacterium]|nr:apolipoprotein N-acyltransferase [Dongiaceae bacterium]
MSRASRDLLLAAFSGVLLAGAFPPHDAWPLAFAALAPLLVACRRAPVRRAAGLGFLTGAVFHLILLYWLVTVMTRFGGLPLPAGVGFLALLAAYLAAYVALFGALVAAASARWGTTPALLLAPPIWVGLEVVRGTILTGFPWGTIGYTQHAELPLLQAAAVGGVHLVSLLVVAVSAGLALLLDRSATAVARLAGAGLLAGVGLAAIAGAWSIPPRVEPAPGEGIEVAAIQANVPQDRKWRRAEEEGIVAHLLAMTATAADSGATLVVWPESSSPLSFRRPVEAARPDGSVEHRVEPRAEYLDQVAALARDRHLAIIAGSVDYRFEEGGWRATNSAFVVGPDGALGPAYDKMHLVPFGEYVPLGRVLFFVDRMVQGAIADFIPGRRFEPLPTPAGAAGTFICYEAIFPGLVRRLARHADFLVNLTNDAWFGKSGAPAQHLAMAVTRAVENRRWILRAANTGISAVVDPAGRVRAREPLDTEAILRARIAAAHGLSLYARCGDVVGNACAIVAALLTVALRAAFLRPGS